MKAVASRSKKRAGKSSCARLCAACVSKMARSKQLSSMEEGKSLAILNDATAELLSKEVRFANPSLAHLEKFKVSPITGVHFWFDREVTHERFITLLDTQTQWIFNKTALYGKEDPAAPGKGQYL